MIDVQRHIQVFDPDRFNPMPIHIIGCGATGSKIAIGIAKLGVQVIHVWDGDIIEAHNIANQLYGNHQIGRPKVEALAEMIEEQTGTKVFAHQQMVEGEEQFEGVVFLLVDTMTGREVIFQKALKNNFKVKQVIETRMGKDFLRIYSFTPFRPNEIAGWTNTLCKDEEAEVSACGSSISVGATADMVAGAAIWQLIKWQSQNDKPDNEWIITVQPASMFAFNF